MADVLNFCILMEMLLVNWSTIHYCAKSKYSLLKTISVLTIFTLVFFAVAYVVWPNLGNGALIVGGLLYAFPLYWLYDVKMDQLLSIMCSSWIYTMFALSFSTQLGYALKQFPFTETVFCVQTLFYICTLKFFRDFFRKNN